MVHAIGGHLLLESPFCYMYTDSTYRIRLVFVLKPIFRKRVGEYRSI